MLMTLNDVNVIYKLVCLLLVLLSPSGHKKKQQQKKNIAALTFQLA